MKHDKSLGASDGQTEPRPQAKETSDTRSGQVPIAAEGRESALYEARPMSAPPSALESLRKVLREAIERGMLCAASEDCEHQTAEDCIYAAIIESAALNSELRAREAAVREECIKIVSGFTPEGYSSEPDCRWAIQSVLMLIGDRIKEQALRAQLADPPSGTETK